MFPFLWKSGPTTKTGLQRVWSSPALLEADASADGQTSDFWGSYVASSSDGGNRFNALGMADPIVPEFVFTPRLESQSDWHVIEPLWAPTPGEQHVSSDNEVWAFQSTGPAGVDQTATVGTPSADSGQTAISPARASSAGADGPVVCEISPAVVFQVLNGTKPSASPIQGPEINPGVQDGRIAIRQEYSAAINAGPDMVALFFQRHPDWVSDASQPPTGPAGFLASCDIPLPAVPDPKASGVPGSSDPELIPGKGVPLVPSLGDWII